MRTSSFLAVVALALTQGSFGLFDRVTVTYVPTITIVTTETVVSIPSQAPIVRNSTLCDSQMCWTSPTATISFLPPTTFSATVTLTSYRTRTSTVCNNSHGSIFTTRTFTSYRTSTSTKVITPPSATTTINRTSRHDPPTTGGANSSSTSSSLPILTVTVYPTVGSTSLLSTNGISGNLSITYKPAYSTCSGSAGNRSASTSRPDFSAKAGELISAPTSMYAADSTIAHRSNMVDHSTVFGGINVPPNPGSTSLAVVSTANSLAIATKYATSNAGKPLRSFKLFSLISRMLNGARTCSDRITEEEIGKFENIDYMGDLQQFDRRHPGRGVKASSYSAILSSPLESSSEVQSFASTTTTTISPIRPTGQPANSLTSVQTEAFVTSAISTIYTVLPISATSPNFGPGPVIASSLPEIRTSPPSDLTTIHTTDGLPSGATTTATSSTTTVMMSETSVTTSSKASLDQALTSSLSSPSIVSSIDSLTSPVALTHSIDPATIHLSSPTFLPSESQQSLSISTLTTTAAASSISSITLTETQTLLQTATTTVEGILTVSETNTIDVTATSYSNTTVTVHVTTVVNSASQAGIGLSPGQTMTATSDSSSMALKHWKCMAKVGVMTLTSMVMMLSLSV